MSESYVAINGTESTAHTCVGWRLCSNTVAVQSLGGGAPAQGDCSRLHTQGQGVGMKSSVRGTEQNIEKGASKCAVECLCVVFVAVSRSS